MDDHTLTRFQIYVQLLFALREHAQGTHCTLFLDYVLMLPDDFAFSHMDNYPPADNYRQQQKSRLGDRLDSDSSTPLYHQFLTSHEDLNHSLQLQKQQSKNPRSRVNSDEKVWKKMVQKTAIAKP
nr:hypothetical protein Iba_chr12cCG3920 [Ipomoea batatas]